MTAVQNSKPSEFVINAQTEEFKGLIGPFFSWDAALNWGKLHIQWENWFIESVYSPFYEYVDGSKK